VNLKPCPFRRVNDEGDILCEKIKSGDRAVSPNICRACPVSAINCAHLRAALDHQARPPITVRWGNGKTEVWDHVEPSITLQRAACAAKVTPIHSPRDCAACAMRQPLGVPETMAVPMPDRRLPTADRKCPATVTAPVAVSRQPSAVVAPVAQAAQTVPVAEPRSSIVAQKIIQLQEWLAKQKNTPPQNTDDDDDEHAVLPIAVGARRVMATPRSEEKRVGWTD